MFINNWYAAAWADQVGESPLRVRMLGMDFVLFRAADGAIICLSDVCCHRGASLADGEARDGCIACPYHGWQFNDCGKVVHIPSLGEEARIPRRARVDAYPVQERYGLLFVFLGDLPADERPLLPDLLPEFRETETWRFNRIDFDWDCNWARLCENSVDTAHPSFVHKRFGNRISPKANIVPIEDRPGYGARITRVRAAPQITQKEGGIASLLPKDRKQTRVELEFTIVGLLEKLRQDMHTGVTQLLWTARTPVDANHTRSFALQGRNFLLEPENDAERIKLFIEAAEEDHRIVSRLKPRHTPRSNRSELIIEPDGMEMALRRKAREAAAALGEIDLERVAATENDTVYVVPSPARREDPTGWTHTPVPLRAAASAGRDLDETAE